MAIITIINRYLQKELYTTLLASTVVLLLIFMSNQFINYLRSAARGEISAHVVMLLLWLRLPVLLGVLLPLSMFITILLVYGRMYADNEMTVLFNSGVSRGQLYKITARFIGVIVVVVTLLSLWLGPYFNHYAATIISRKEISPLELIQPAHFQSFMGGKWLLYVSGVSHEKGDLQKVFIADQDKGGGVLVAQSGRQHTDEQTGDIFLVLNNGNRYSGIPGERNFQLINFKQYGVRLSQDKAITSRKAIALSTLQLLHLHRDNQQSAEFQWRISIPIMALILGFMAVPLSRVKKRHNRYAQLVPAILLYIIYGNFMFVSRAWIQNGMVSHGIGMWWVHIIMSLVMGGLIINQIGWKRLRHRA